MRKLVSILVCTTVFGVTLLLAAGSAAATVLCEQVQTSSCTTDVEGGTKVALSAESSIALKDPFSITIATCTESLVEGTTSTEGGLGDPVSATIGTLTFGSCNRQVTVNTGTTGSIEVQPLAGTAGGTVISDDTIVLIHEVPYPFPSTCAYRATDTSIGTLTGSLTQPTFDIAATIPTETEGCPDGIWEGKHKYTGTTPFIVSAG